MKTVETVIKTTKVRCVCCNDCLACHLSDTGVCTEHRALAGLPARRKA